MNEVWFIGVLYAASLKKNQETEILPYEVPCSDF